MKASATVDARLPPRPPSLFVAPKGLPNLKSMMQQEDIHKSATPCHKNSAPRRDLSALKMHVSSKSLFSDSNVF